jgi:carbon monoxide dehydrogenase subunit G
VKTSFAVDDLPEAWAALADPDRLAVALPGCRSVARDQTEDAGGFRVVADVAVASVRGLWSGTVVPVDAGAVRIRGTGEPGTVDVVVRADPDRTLVTVEGTVEGPLATVGTAVLAAAVRRTAHELLAAAAAPHRAAESPARLAEPGDGQGSGTGTPTAASPRPGRRVPAGAVVVAGVAAVVVVAGGRSFRRARARGRSAR